MFKKKMQLREKENIKYLLKLEAYRYKYLSQNSPSQNNNSI